MSRININLVLLVAKSLFNHSLPPPTTIAEAIYHDEVYLSRSSQPSRAFIERNCECVFWRRTFASFYIQQVQNDI